MKKILLIALAMGFAPLSHAACRTGTLEIGDIGPADTGICETLESRYPGSESRIVDREILAPDRVSVRVEVDGTARRLEYRLTGYRWQLGSTDRVANQ